MRAFFWLLLIAAIALWGLAILSSTEPPAASAPGPPDAPLLNALVSQNLRLADEADPLQRAQAAGVVAEALSDAVARAAVRGDHDKVISLSKQLARVLAHGIRLNVELLDPEGLDGDQLALWTKLNQRPDEIVQELEVKVQGLGQPLPEPLKEPFAEDPKDKKAKGKDKDKKAKDKGKDVFKDKGKKGKDKKAKDVDGTEDMSAKSPKKDKKSQKMRQSEGAFLDSLDHKERRLLASVDGVMERPLSNSNRSGFVSCTAMALQSRRMRKTRRC